MKKQQLIDLVIEEIKKDIASGDVTALDELLSAVPEEHLKGYLPESKKIYKFPRRCNVTGKGMWEGFCFGDGEEYAKDRESAEIIAKRDGYASLDESFDDEHHYWTEWEDLDEDEWYESEHEDGTNAVPKYKSWVE